MIANYMYFLINSVNYIDGHKISLKKRNNNMVDIESNFNVQSIFRFGVRVNRDNEDYLKHKAINDRIEALELNHDSLDYTQIKKVIIEQAHLNELSDKLIMTSPKIEIHIADKRISILNTILKQTDGYNVAENIIVDVFLKSQFGVRSTTPKSLSRLSSKFSDGDFNYSNTFMTETYDSIKDGRVECSIVSIEGSDLYDRHFKIVLDTRISHLLKKEFIERFVGVKSTIRGGVANITNIMATKFKDHTRFIFDPYNANRKLYSSYFVKPNNYIDLIGEINDKFALFTSPPIFSSTLLNTVYLMSSSSHKIIHSSFSNKRFSNEVVIAMGAQNGFVKQLNSQKPFPMLQDPDKSDCMVYITKDQERRVIINGLHIEILSNYDQRDVLLSKKKKYNIRNHNLDFSNYGGDGKPNEDNKGNKEAVVEVTTPHDPNIMNKFLSAKDQIKYSNLIIEVKNLDLELLFDPTYRFLTVNNEVSIPNNNSKMFLSNYTVEIDVVNNNTLSTMCLKHIPDQKSFRQHMTDNTLQQNKYDQELSKKFNDSEIDFVQKLINNQF